MWRRRRWRVQPMHGHARGLQRQDGAALVETALAMAVYLVLLFGMIAFCYALYAYNFVSNAARLATRYAVVRGSDSCVIAPAFPDCDMPNTTPASALQTYVQNLGYPGLNSNYVTVTATWVNPITSYDSLTGITSVTGWNTTCIPPTSTDLYCNNPGDAVNVVVNYQFPLNIPFWQNTTLNLSSTSQMVINW